MSQPSLAIENEPQDQDGVEVAGEIVLMLQGLPLINPNNAVVSASGAASNTR